MRNEPVFDGIGVDFVFSLDGKRAACTGQNGQQWFLVVDGKVGASIEGIVNGTLTFSPDGKRLACAVAKPDRSACLLVDGKRGSDYDALGCFEFSPDGKHTAFTAKKGDKNLVVVDGVERGEYDRVPAGPVFRSDGSLEFLAANKPSLYRIEVKDF